ncbi:MAG: helix-turn-helix domain-containing protein [Candidatus Scatosoma sp.]
MLFSQRITEAIKASKYSQKQIAQILNISESNITNWKKGENLPSVDILYKLCLILEESSDYLLGLEDETGSKTYNNYGIHNGNVKF